MENKQLKKQRTKNWKILLGFVIASGVIAGAGKDLLDVLIRENDFWVLSTLIFLVLIAGYAVGVYENER